MFVRSGSTFFVALALWLITMQAPARHSKPPPQPPQPVLFEGHYYQVVISNKISWEAAKAAAEQKSYQGIQGHLATIGSLEEDQFLHQLRQQVLSAPHPSLSGTELWVGGYQLPCATTTPEPGCGWIWLNDQPIDSENGDSPYTNWQNGEPNNLKLTADAYHRASEDFLAIGLNGAFGWNDEGNLTNVWGYIIEYGDQVTVDASTCTAGQGGCNPSGAQVFELPATAILAPDATLTARTYVFHDDPNRCGNSSLTLFGGAIVIPPYLCGHPDFIVIQTATSGVNVPTGVIDVENLTENVLPDNLFGCTAVRQNPAGVIDPDPSHRDVVAWQTTNPQEMLETSLGTGRFAGTVAEVTYGCGSSRGKVINGSFHFVGLRIHPGPGNEFTDGNSQGNHQSFIELTRYKLQLLQASVVASKYALSLQAYQTLKSQIDAAIALHDCGRYKDALAKIILFLRTVDCTTYAIVPGENFNGDHIMRASNIKFMYTEKVLPFC